GLARLTGAGEVVQGRLDRALSVAAWEEGDDAEYERYLVDHGMPADLAAASTRAEIGTAVELAVPTRLVDEGDIVDAGGRRWRILHLPGHADGHIALHDEAGGRLLGGDARGLLGAARRPGARSRRSAAAGGAARAGRARPDAGRRTGARAGAGAHGTRR